LAARFRSPRLRTWLGPRLLAARLGAWFRAWLVRPLAGLDARLRAWLFPAGLGSRVIAR
jgi:hypothetical protein